MKRKLLTLILALLFVACSVCFFACGGTGDNSSDTNNGQQQQQDNPSGESSTEEDEKTSNDNKDDDETNVVTATEGLAYELSSDQSYYICTGIGTATATDITIASSYNNLPVKEIGFSAFSNCTNLQEITIPNSVVVIGAGAFYYCSNLQRITIPNSVTSIGSSVFYNCSNLQYYEYDNAKYLGNSDNNYVVLVKAKNTSITSCEINANTKIIGSVAFAECVNLQNIAIPNGIITIEGAAFAECENLQSIIIPDSVKSIGREAFRICSSLQSVTIGSGLTSVWYDTFLACPSLESITVDGNNAYLASQDGILYDKAKTEFLHVPRAIIGNVTIPNSVVNVYGSVFQNCNNLEGITVESGNTKYHSAGNCIIETASRTLIAGCKNSVIPTDGSVTSIGNYAFYGCSGLTSITIPNSVTSIGDFAFSGCSLTSITIPSGVTSIGDSVFEGCISFQSINVDVNNINYASQDGILYNKAKTEIIEIPQAISGEVTIPNGVDIIGYCEFYGCSSLTGITIPNSVTSIGDLAFYGCSLTSITIPSSVTSIGSGVFESCTSLQSINVDVNNINYASQDGILYNKAKTEIITFPQAISGEVIIPSSVNIIRNGALYACISLTSITIPNSVTSIGRAAFYDCSSLTSIEFTGTMAEWNNITKGIGWNENTGNYTVYCTDGDIAKS